MAGEHDDIGEQFARALDELGEWAEEVRLDNDGRPTTWHVWAADDITEEEQVLIDQAIEELDAVRYGRPENRGPDGAGPR